MIPKRLEYLTDPDLPPARLFEVFSQAGEEIYLVGGSVRDAFLERPFEDFDFATSARPEKIAFLLSGWADVVYRVGEAFGTVAAQKDGWTVEVTTFRKEIYREDSRKPTVTFSDDIQTDLSRRDFTINAVALALPNLEPIDPHSGLADLASRVGIKLPAPGIVDDGSAPGPPAGTMAPGNPHDDAPLDEEVTTEVLDEVVEAEEVVLGCADLDELSHGAPRRPSPGLTCPR